MKARLVLAVLLTAALGGMTACSEYHETAQPETEVTNDYQQSVHRFLNVDPGMQRFWDTAYAYVIYPTVTKGGAIIGGAHGDGAAYVHGKLVGYTTVTQASIGAQLGGQSFSEVIFFQDQASFNQFTRGQFELTADASVVAASRGASANADYKRGVAVFTLPESGLMVEAAVGGQKFSFRPTNQASY